MNNALRFNRKILFALATVGGCAAIAFVLILSPHRASAQTTQLSACESGESVPIITYAYSNGWLLCNSADDNEGSEQLYKETSVGSGVFNFVRAGGGWYSPADLEQLAGVGGSDAETLVNTISYNLGTGRVGMLPGWRRTCGTTNC
jgi:hypothetical protein